MAKWSEVTTTENYTIYVDKGSLRKTGNIAKIWILKDYFNGSSFDRKAFLSAVNLTQYDCKNELLRVASASTYSGNMGAEIVVLTDNSGSDKWRMVVPNSASNFLWKLACKKKWPL